MKAIKEIHGVDIYRLPNGNLVCDPAAFGCLTISKMNEIITWCEKEKPLGWQRSLSLQGYEVIADATLSPHVQLKVEPDEIKRMSDKDMVIVLKTFAAIAPEIEAIGTAEYSNFNMQFLSPDDLRLIAHSGFATEEQREKAKLCLTLGHLPKHEYPEVLQPKPVKEAPHIGFVYLLHGGGYYKIGLSKEVDKRLEQISPKLPFEVKLIHTIKTDDMVWLEQHLHEIFEKKRTNGEWFKLDASDVEWLLTHDEWNKEDQHGEQES